MNIANRIHSRWNLYSIIRLKDHTKDLLNNIGKATKYQPNSSPIVMPTNDNEFTNTIFDLIAEKKEKYTVAPLSIGIAYALTLYDEIIENEYELQTVTNWYARQYITYTPVDIIQLILVFISRSIADKNMTPIEKLKINPIIIMIDMCIMVLRCN